MHIVSLKSGRIKMREWTWGDGLPGDRFIILMVGLLRGRGFGTGEGDQHLPGMYGLGQMVLNERR